MSGIATSHSERHPLQTRGFTLLELLVVIGIIAFLAALILVAMSGARRSAASVQCLSNLRQIHSAFVHYANDHGGRLPDPIANGTSWEASLYPYLKSTDVFRCGADEEVFPAVGSSYDWRDTGSDTTSLVGRSMALVRQDAALAFDALPGWHKRNRINVILVDGSAHSMDQDDYFRELAKPIAGQ